MSSADLTEPPVPAASRRPEAPAEAPGGTLRPVSVPEQGRRGGFGPGAGSGSASAIASWVQENFAGTTVGGVTVYDLTQPASTSATGT